MQKVIVLRLANLVTKLIQLSEDHCDVCQNGLKSVDRKRKVRVCTKHKKELLKYLKERENECE